MTPRPPATPAPPASPATPAPPASPATPAPPASPAPAVLVSLTSTCRSEADQKPGRRAPTRPLTDRWALALAVCTALGAWASRPVPVLAAGAVAVAALGLRQRVGLCIACAVLASGLGARAWAGLVDPPPGATWSGPAVLVSDPAPAGHGVWRADVRLGRRRAEAWLGPRRAGPLTAALAGERLYLAGALVPVTGHARAYLARRHIAARLIVYAVGERSPAPPPTRLANGIRRTIMRGADVLPPEPRALFGGFVLGDQRQESDATKEDFRRSGLSHLLVVSGENVAFVLALVEPGLRRLRLGPRLLAALAVLTLFGLLTRGEPSVLRAEAMAGLAVLAAALGRPVSTKRLLCVAATALLLIDPLLVGSVAFALSVGATAGIAWLAPWFHRRLPLAVAVTAAAQVGVAPVLIGVFGGVPVASLPANLLAIPAAGPVMMWGVAAGLPAGLLGRRFAGLVHLPTRLLIGWVALVAHRFARAPMGEITAPAFAAGAAGAALVVVVRRRVGSARAARSRPP